MGDRLCAGKPSRYVTSQPCQLSLVIPSWVGAVSVDNELQGKDRAWLIRDDGM